jgi:hypothetical protein
MNDIEIILDNKPEQCRIIADKPFKPKKKNILSYHLIAKTLALMAFIKLLNGCFINIQ